MITLPSLLGTLIVHQEEFRNCSCPEVPESFIIASFLDFNDMGDIYRESPYPKADFDRKLLKHMKFSSGDTSLATVGCAGEVFKELRRDVGFLVYFSIRKG